MRSSSGGEMWQLRPFVVFMNEGRVVFRCLDLFCWTSFRVSPTGVKNKGKQKEFTSFWDFVILWVCKTNKHTHRNLHTHKQTNAHAARIIIFLIVIIVHASIIFINVFVIVTTVFVYLFNIIILTIVIITFYLLSYSNVSRDSGREPHSKTGKIGYYDIFSVSKKRWILDESFSIFME